MKKSIKITAMVTMSMLIFASGVVSASTVKKQIKAVLNKSTKFTLNGNNTTLKNDKGKKVYPIQYNDNYYVPVNSICNILRTPVVVNSKKNSITIGEREDKSLIDKEFTMTAGNSVFSTIQRTTDKSHLTLGNVVFNKGIIYNIDEHVVDKDLTVTINGKYSKLSFSAFGDNSTPLTLSVVDGDRDVELASMQISNRSVSSLKDIPIGGIKKIIFRPEKNDNASKLTIGDPIVK
ncbi:hypothetical protein [Clostridium oryzae]|uniref:Copper amine oxidase-like N-terminal domain-containing protein n=1 Tax=Clostridium oryzae TaxID=1450648 RepID=A0A1V4ICR4_9CLOT|nr:hypothetical protein [Clostridium oryzae]OPJ57425.1 hypothetical protein CLORY_41180 [Clostridium oryzae]